MKRSSIQVLLGGVLGAGLLLAPLRADISVPLGTLQPGESVRLSFEVTIDDPLDPALTQIAQQATVTHAGGIILSDDPETAALADPTSTPLADLVAPTVVAVTRIEPTASPATASSVVFLVEFSEPVVGVDAGDFVVGGTSAGITDVMADGERAYAVSIGGGDLDSINTTVTFAFAATQDIADLSGNPLTETTPTGTDESSCELLNNDAPVLTPFAPMLPTVEANPDFDNPGISVADIVGSSISDPDAGALQGIALLLPLGNEVRWSYSTDGGVTWAPVGNLPPDLLGIPVLLLRAQDMLRAESDGYHSAHGGVPYLAWDRTNGTAGLAGQWFALQPSHVGGSGTFSLAVDVATVHVNGIDRGTFSEWVYANFTPSQRARPEISGPDSDPDGAGVSNLMRYALGLPARGPVVVPIEFVTVNEAGADYAGLRFPRRAGDVQLLYTLEASDDLVNWVEQGSCTADDGSVTTLRDQAATSGLPRRFLRLLVQFRAQAR